MDGTGHEQGQTMAKNKRDRKVRPKETTISGTKGKRGPIKREGLCVWLKPSTKSFYSISKRRGLTCKDAKPKYYGPFLSRSSCQKESYVMTRCHRLTSWCKLAKQCSCQKWRPSLLAGCAQAHVNVRAKVGQMFSSILDYTAKVKRNGPSQDAVL